MPDISDVNWTEQDDRNTQGQPNGWPGGMPAYIDTIGRMMMGAVKRSWNRSNPVYETEGTGDDYIVFPEVSFPRFNEFEILRLRIDRANTTTTPTLQFGEWVQAPIRKASSTGVIDLVPGDIIAGADQEFWYDGTQFILSNPGTLDPGIDAGLLHAAANLSDVDDVAEARANLDLGSAATEDASAFLQPGDIGTTVQAHSANLDTLAGVTPGEAGVSILAAETAADVLNYLDAPIYVGTRTALKAVDPTEITTVILTEGVPARSGRMGTFVWAAGDFSDEVTADPNEGVYVASTVPGSPATSGCWVRSDWDDIDPRWFGCKGDNITDDRANFQAVINFIDALQLERKTISLGNARYLFASGTVNVPETCMHGEMYGNGAHASQFRSSDITAGQVFLWQGEGWHFRDFRLQNDTFDVTNVIRYGFFLTKNYGAAVPTADIDAKFTNVEISRFYRGINIIGRGLRVDNCLFSVSYNPVGIGFPAVGTYTPGPSVQSDAAGFRGYHFTGNRFHSNIDAAIVNIDANAAKLVGIVITGHLDDIGRPLFKGHLGSSGGNITGNVITLTPLEGLQITGGTAYRIGENTICGSEGIPDGDRIPPNWIDLTGNHELGTIENNIFRRCTQHGINIRDGVFRGIIQNNTFIDPCRDVGVFAPITFVGPSHKALVRGNTVVTSNALTGFVRGDNATQSITVQNTHYFDTVIPDFVGSGQAATRGTLGSVASPYEKIYVNKVGIIDSTNTPADETGVGNLWISSTDGDFKIKFGDAVVKVIVADT